MAQITTRETAGTGATVAGVPLTNAQIDQNFINLNVDVINHKYHSFSNDQYFFDDYEQGRYFRLFTENATSDNTRFGAIQDVEYWNGSAWVIWSDVGTLIKNLLDGRQDTYCSIDHTHKKFRFTVTKNTGWPTKALIVLQTTWTGFSYTTATVTIEGSTQVSGGTWTVRDTSIFGSGTSGNNWGVHTKVTNALHTGEVYNRITIDLTDWVDSGIYTLYPLVSFSIYSNYAGSPLEPWSWNYDKVVNFQAVPTVLGNSLLTSSNYSTYALPIAGGTLTGALSVPSQFTVRAQGGAEGGEIVLQKGTGQTGVSGDLIIDYQGNTVRFFENGGSVRQFLFDLTNGNITGQNGILANINGNSATATILATARTINGVSFNGSANITVADSTKLPLAGGALTGTVSTTKPITSSNDVNVDGSNFLVNTVTKSVALYAYEVQRSGTAVGGILINGAGTFATGTTIAGNTALHAGNYNTYSPALTGTGASGTWGISITGNAGTATTLQTARTINGVSFNGSANITVADSTKLPLAGGTLTGSLLTNIGGGTSSSTKHIDLVNGTGYDLFMLPRAGSGSYNPLVVAGDAVIGFSAGAVDTGALVLGAWATTAVGLRLDRLGATTLNASYGTTQLQDNVGFVLNGNYVDGRYSHRLRKFDDGGGVPLYIQYTMATAGTWTNLARFGPNTADQSLFRVFGDSRTDGNLTVIGTVQHTGLTMTAGTAVDQVYSVTDTLTLTTAWQDTTVNAAELATGTYAVQVLVNDNAVNGGHWSTYYSGVMSWYAADTNEASSDEIMLHRAGHASTIGNLYLRVLRTLTADTANLKLQIAGSTTNTGTSTYQFKFRRLI